MRRLIAIFLILWLALPLTSQSINPNQIQPGTNGQVLLTTGGATVWGAAPSSGVQSINSTTGAFTFTGSGVSCTSTTCTFSGGGSGAVPTNVIFASQGNGTAAACTLNSNLLTGGGTDVTTCLQAQLDWLGANGGGVWILNGPALISNATVGTTNSVDSNFQTAALQTHSNVTIYVPTGGGVFLKASSNCLMLGNNITGNPSATFQTNMRVIGAGFWNGNNANQSKYEQGNSSNGWNFGMWFGGFSGLEISGQTLYNVATFNILLSNGENYSLSNDTETVTTTVPGLSLNQDGIHLCGTLSNGVINNFTDNAGDDDPIAFNTDECVASYNQAAAWEYQRYSNSGGAISNVLVNGETLAATNNVMRFFGETTTNGVATLTNVAMRNVAGTQTGVGVNNGGLTSCTNILIDNWTVSKSGTVVDPNLSGSSCTVTAGQENITAPSFTVAGASGGTYVKADGTGSGTPSTGLSGMTSGQVPLAASASTVTSSKALAGSGAGIATGPTTTTNGDCVEFTGTAGQLADAGSACGSGSGFITSLTTTGTSGAATVTSGVLNIPQYSGGTFQPSYLPFPPAATAFTWVNQGSATESNNGNMITLGIPYTSALNWRFMEKSLAYSTPWSVAAYWKSAQQNSSATSTGLYLYDGTKLLGIELLQIGASPYVELRVERITNVTTDDATEATLPFSYAYETPGTNQYAAPTPNNGGLYVRWRDNGTNLYADWSIDGANWANFYSEAVGAFITPTAYGFGGIQQASGGSQYATIIDLEGWLETNSATL